MKKVSINELHLLTGFDRSTVTKKIAPLPFLKEGRSHLYESDIALPMLYSKDGNVYDTEVERARLTHHQANNEALREAERRGELVSADMVLSAWQEKLTAMRAKLLSMPTKLTPLVISADDTISIESLIRAAIHDALDELSGTGLPQDVEKRLAAIGRGITAAAEPDGEPMGGAGTAAIS